MERAILGDSPATARRPFGIREASSLLSLSSGVIANLCGVSVQWENFPAVNWIFLEDFQNIFGDIWKSLENILFSKNLSKQRCSYLGLPSSPPPQLVCFCWQYRFTQRKTIFLLLMEANLAESLRGMTLGEDKTIVIPDEPAYCAMERGGRSLLGRLLNPECQNMGRMLRTMPKIWKVYEMARGIALTKEIFQFVFDLESDIQMVLKQGFWTFDDWGLALERWVENPPPNFLQTAMIWIRLKNLPANYLTWKTIDTIADGIGHVKIIEFDPEKPHVLDYVRVQVILDVNLPLRDKKSVTLPGGRVEYVDVEYERVRKKCFHCFRLSHEKPRCPLWQGARSKGKGVVNRQSLAEIQPVTVRQHHTDLVDKLMPLLAQPIPPGFEPSSSVVVPEVFQHMKLYMECADSEERKIREAKMKKTLQELSNDPIAQRSCLRLESAPVLSPETNRDRGRVFDFSRMENPVVPDVSDSTSRGQTRQRRRLDFKSTGDDVGLNVATEVTARYLLPQGTDNLLQKPSLRESEEGYVADKENAISLAEAENGGFVVGSGETASGERHSRSRNSHHSQSSWVRRNQSHRKHTASRSDQSWRNRGEGAPKRKAFEDGEVSSKGSKQVKGSVVSRKPSNAQ